MKILHTADLHLGIGFGKFSGEVGSKRRQDLLDTFRKIVDTAKEQKVDAVLIAGDLFNSPKPPNHIVSFVNRELSRLGRIPVLISAGNHDCLKEDCVYLNNAFPDNVFVFKNNNFEKREIASLTVYGISYDHQKPNRNVLRDFKPEKTKTPVVVMLHGSYEGLKWAENLEGGTYNPFERKDVSQLETNYIALGHYHRNNEICSNPICCYAGSPEGLTFDETGERVVNIVTISKNKTQVEKFPINKREIKVQDIDCSNFETIDDIRKILEKEADENKILALILRGFPDVNFTVDVEELKEVFSRDFFYLDIINKLSPPKDLKKHESQTVKGIFIKEIEKAISQAKSKEEKDQLQKVLRTGIGILEGKIK